MLGKYRQIMKQEIAKITGVQDAQTVLILGIDRLALIIAKLGAFARRHLFRGPAAVLPLIDQARHQLGRPALGIDVLRFQHLLDQALLIVRVQDGKGGF